MELFLQKLVAGISELDPVDFYYLLFLFIIAISLFFLAYVAARFLSVWSSELKYRKRSVLASDIMENLIKVQDIITKVRNPFVFPGERREIVEHIKATNCLPFYESKILDIVPLYRINRYRNEIDGFFALRAQAQLCWKDEALNMFKKLSNIIENIEYSSRFLYEYNLDENERNKYKNNIWFNKEKDFISADIDNIVLEFRTNMESFYKSNRISWKKIKISD